MFFFVKGILQINIEVVCCLTELACGAVNLRPPGGPTYDHLHLYQFLAVLYVLHSNKCIIGKWYYYTCLMNLFIPQTSHYRRRSAARRRTRATVAPPSALAPPLAAIM